MTTLALFILQPTKIIVDLAVLKQLIFMSVSVQKVVKFTHILITI